MTTKKALADKPESHAGEFDVSFGDGELGMRLEERGSFKTSSVVVRVSKEGGNKAGEGESHALLRPSLLFWWAPLPLALIAGTTGVKTFFMVGRSYAGKQLDLCFEVNVA